MQAVRVITTLTHKLRIETDFEPRGVRIDVLRASRIGSPRKGLLNGV
jgi:hypothetical protein